MGLFDSVLVRCPHCGEPAEIQSKADEFPYMNVFNFPEGSIPRHILRDVINRPVFHQRCKKWFSLVDEIFPPFSEEPPINPRAMKVRPPHDPVTHSQGFQWWPGDQDFGRDDLIDGDR